MTTARASWRPLMVKGAWNPDLRAKLRQASGAYVIRRADDRVIEYVGESHTGRLWKTLQRHFQRGSGAFEDRSEYVRTSPAPFEVAVWVTSKGGREKRKGDQAALDTQAALIERYKPTDNRDDGKAYGPCPHGCTSWRCARAHLVPEQGRGEEAPADDDFPFGANREEERGAFDDLLENPPRGPAALPPNVPIERRAEMRTPSLFTGRTRLEDEGAKMRRDWKGEAERLGRELAACRAAPPPSPVEKKATPPAPRTLPAGYGETDEKGQATMFRRNPRKQNPGALEGLGAEEAEDLGMPLAGLPPSSVRLVSGNGEYYLYDGNGRSWLGFADDKAAATWSLKAVKAARAYMSKALAPAPTAKRGEVASWWLELAEALPKLPSGIGGLWRAEHGTVYDSSLSPGHDWIAVATYWQPVTGKPGASLSAETKTFQQKIAASLATLAKLAAVYPRVRSKRFASREELQRAICNRRSSYMHETVEPAAKAMLRAEFSLLVLMLDEEPAEPRAPKKEPRKRSAAPSKARAPKVDSVDRVIALWDRAATTRGDEGERAYREYIDAASALPEEQKIEFNRRAALHGLEPERPAGYGTEAKGGQLKLFNPAKRAGVGLVALGRLESIVVRQKNAERTLYFRGAVLAYDAAGRLVIVHGPKPFGAATREEAKEYRRTHWGARAKGKALSGRILEGRAGVRSLGSVTEITYITKKGRAAEAAYFHHFGRPGEGPAKTPRLPVLEAGEVGGVTLYRLRGGTYTVEARGIVG